MPDPRNSVQSRSTPSRVVFVRQRFNPFGGGELILDRTITALLSHGVKVSLLGRSWTERKDIDFISCNPPRFPRFSRERRFADAACKLLVSETTALVQSHERMPCCDIFRAGDGSHAAFIEHRARGLGGLSAAALRLNPYHRSVIALEHEMFTSQRLRAVIVNSQMVADEIRRLYSVPTEKIHQVPNGIDLVRFSSDARQVHRQEIRRKLGTDMNRPVLLFVGSGYKRKGLDTAIAALAESKADAELWVVGNDKQPDAYRRQAERAGLGDRLRIIGPMKDTVPYYAAADALILPTVYDPFPSTVVEALACGLPVVTSTGCGARDAAARLDLALVRDTYDVPGFADAICRALDLASKPGTILEANAIARDYGIESMIDRMLRIYQILDA